MILRHRGKAFDSNTNLLEIYRPRNDCQEQAPNGAAHFPQADFWPVQGLNIQVKTVVLKTDYFRVARYAGAICTKRERRYRLAT